MIALHSRSRNITDEEREFLFSVTRAAFSQRRKTLVNALSSLFAGQLDKEQLQSAVVACGFDPRVRGETLSLDDFIRLSNIIMQMI